MQISHRNNIYDINDLRNIKQLRFMWLHNFDTNDINDTYIVFNANATTDIIKKISAELAYNPSMAGIIATPSVIVKIYTANDIELVEAMNRYIKINTVRINTLVEESVFRRLFKPGWYFRIRANIEIFGKPVYYPGMYINTINVSKDYKNRAIISHTPVILDGYKIMLGSEDFDGLCHYRGKLIYEGFPFATASIWRVMHTLLLIHRNLPKFIVIQIMAHNHPIKFAENAVCVDFAKLCSK